MLYQINNKAQSVAKADYSVDNFLSVFETLHMVKMSNLMRTQCVTMVHGVQIGDENGVRLPYL